MDPFSISEFEVCSSKTLCFRRYLVKADRNANLSKAKSKLGRWREGKGMGVVGVMGV